MSERHPNAPDDAAEKPKNLPAKADAAAKEETQASKQRARQEAMIAALETRGKQLATLLQDSGIDPPRFVEVFRRALTMNPDLVACDAGSVLTACINAATDGLLPDGRQGAIVVYNTNASERGQPARYVKKAQWQPMYQGLLQVAYSSGNFQSIQARVVYDGDDFHYSLGIRPSLHHVPGERPAGTAPKIVAAYAVALTVNGGEFLEVFEGEDIRKVNAVSRATKGPGKDWPEEMARKGPLRRMWKYLPKNQAMERIVEHHDENFDLDQLEADAPPPKTRLQAGFGKQAALQQGADQVVDTGQDQEGEFVDAGQSGDGEAAEQHNGVVGGDRRRRAEGPTDGPGDADKAVDGQDQAGGEGSGDGEDAGIARFEAALEAATSWLNIKQALRDLGKVVKVTAPPRVLAWDRFVELRDAGAKMPDFVSDPLLFEMWLDGAEPDGDAIDGNWRVLQQDRDFLKLPKEERDRVAAHVEEVKAQ